MNERRRIGAVCVFGIAQGQSRKIGSWASSMSRRANHSSSGWSSLRGRLDWLALNSTTSIGGILDAAATAPQPKQLWFNAGTSVLTGHEELVGLIRKFFPKFTCEVLPGKAGSSRDSVLDISAAKAQIGWAPKYTLEAALADYIEEVKTRGRA